MNLNTPKLLFMGVLIIYGFGCSVSKAKLINNDLILPSESKQDDLIKIISVNPRNEADYKISNHIALLPNQELWAKGGWNSQTDFIYNSSDQGKNWKEIKLPVDTISVSGEIYFTDLKEGWVVGWQRIVKTEDGGSNWKSLKLPNNSKIADLQAVSFFDSKIGYISGQTGIKDKEGKFINGLEILCTRNGGESWTVCYRTTDDQSSFQILTVSETSAIVLVHGISLIKTNDQGNSWEKIEIPSVAASMAKSPKNFIWLVGDNNFFEYSKNAGRTWEKASLQEIDNASWSAIDFDNRGNGIAVGKNGIIAFTKNNGIDWLINNKITTENLVNVKIRDSFAVIMGEKNIISVEFKGSIDSTRKIN